MPDFSFNVEVSTLVASGARVGLIVALAFVFNLVFGRVTRRVVQGRIVLIKNLQKTEVDQRTKTISATINKGVSVVVWAVAAVMVLGELGVAIGPLIAGLGVGALALGFAAQNVIRDFLHGFFIITEDWYRVGEVVSVGGQTGAVVDVSLRRTQLRDGEGTLHNIPNSQIDQASTLTREFNRVLLDVEVGYNEDLDEAIRVLNDECEKIKADEKWGGDFITAPAVLRVNSLGASGIALRIMADYQPMRKWALMGEMRLRLKKHLDAEGIEIPWPHTKVYLGNAMPEAS